MSANLTKKQQKALAFRSKQKAKKSGREETVPEDVPEQDLDDDNDEGQPDLLRPPVVAEPSKKRKRDGVDVGETVTVTVTDTVKKEDGGKDTDKSKTKGKGKAKAKTAWDEDGNDEEDGEKASEKSKKEVKQRFILFIGNLDYKTTREDIAAHFKESVGSTPSVRLLTTKPTPSSSKSKPAQSTKSRGIAFLEVPSSTAMQACLKLHHSILQRRRINVELTAGGGGKGEGRKEKIKERNERVGGQRERRAEREKEEGGEGGEEGYGGEGAGGVGTGHGRGWGGEEMVEQKDGKGPEKVVEVVNADGTITKVRGGRRVKAKPSGQSGQSGGQGDGRASQRGRSDGDGRRGGYQGQARRGGPGVGGGVGGGGGGRRRFEPTGANALTVG